MRVAAVQTTAGEDRTANLAAAEALVREAAAAGAELVVLPEYFSVAGSPAVLRSDAETLEGPTLSWARGLARSLGIHLVAGSVPERAGPATDLDGRVYNTSCLVGPAGTVEAAYRKIHLFDADIDGRPLRESTTVAPGDRPCVQPLGAAGGPDRSVPVVLGLTICYDLRFPELYRALALAGATVVTVPAAFTATTGPAHWEVLLRARAVENETFVVAAGQVGTLPPGMPPCHGHSMVVDPWGTVLAERRDDSPGVVVADLEFDHLRRIRSELPVLANRRPAAYRWPDDSAGPLVEHRG